MIQASSKKELIEAINSLGEATRRVYINARPSMDVVNLIVSSAPNVEEIYCPPSLLKQASTKVFETLKDRGVRLTHKKVRVGRPNIYTDETIDRIAEQRAAGISVKNISRDLGIPLRTVYYYLKNAK